VLPSTSTKVEAVLEQLAQQPQAVGVQAFLQLRVGHPRGLVTGQPVHHRGEPSVGGGKRGVGVSAA
jgi:hypothetical protein